MYINCSCNFTHEIETLLKTRPYSLNIICETNFQSFARNLVGKNVKHKLYTLCWRYIHPHNWMLYCGKQWLLSPTGYLVIFLHNSYTPHTSSMCIVKSGLLGATSSCLLTQCSFVRNTELQCFAPHFVHWHQVYEKERESQKVLYVMKSSSYVVWKKNTGSFCLKKC